MNLLDSFLEEGAEGKILSVQQSGLEPVHVIEGVMGYYDGNRYSGQRLATSQGVTETADSGIDGKERRCPLAATVKGICSSQEATAGQRGITSEPDFTFRLRIIKNDRRRDRNTGCGLSS